MKIKLYAGYIYGYLRRGHFEGEINYSKEQEKEFKTLLKKEFNNEELTTEEEEKLDCYKEEVIDNSSIIIDDYDIEDWGEIEWEDLLD